MMNYIMEILGKAMSGLKINIGNRNNSDNTRIQ